jgi:hypothetical protein
MAKTDAARVPVRRKGIRGDEERVPNRNATAPTAKVARDRARAKDSSGEEEVVSAADTQTTEIDNVARAELLSNLMYDMAQECLNLARFEDEPQKRSSLVQAGLSSANGWCRMSDLCARLAARRQEAGQ